MAEGQMTEHGVSLFDHGSGFEVIDVLTNAHDTAGHVQLTAHRSNGSDGRGGSVGSVEVPSIEAAKVLNTAEDFFATV